MAEDFPSANFGGLTSAEVIDLPQASGLTCVSAAGRRLRLDETCRRTFGGAFFRVPLKRVGVPISQGRHVDTLHILGASRKDKSNDSRTDQDRREDDLREGRMGQGARWSEEG